ncbi:MAG: NADP-dependent oxidoreductase [Caldilineaceae bacterium]|nr:NADP-dependent oxidoreductase [Caldilineaceae bacterium]
MKAVRVNQWGQPVQLEEIPQPTPGADEVLVRVHASSINPIDGIIAAGHMSSMYTAPMTLGTDFSGEVAAAGGSVSHVKPGDAVYGMSLSRGAFAEYAAVKAVGVAHKPKSLDDAQAAAVPLAGLTAWQTLFNLAQLKSGERLLIHGAAGNIGTFAVQLAKDAGAHVIGSDIAAKARFLRELGADQVIDAQSQRFENEVDHIDVVLDLVGRDLVERSFNILKPGGRYVTSAAQPSQEEAERRGIKAYSTFTQPTVEELTKLAELIDAGKLKVFVGRTFPLAETQAALEFKPPADAEGKVIVLVG